MAMLFYAVCYRQPMLAIIFIYYYVDNEDAYDDDDDDGTNDDDDEGENNDFRHLDYDNFIDIFLNIDTKS